LTLKFKIKRPKSFAGEAKNFGPLPLQPENDEPSIHDIGWFFKIFSIPSSF
jgi:hypothetical protein